VITLDDVEVIVPNATLAKAPITNFTKPFTHSRRSLYVQVPANVPPNKVQRAILEALPGSFGVLAEPEPSVVTNAFTEGNVEYWIRFFTDRFDKRDGVDGAARDRIWAAFSRAGIPFASPSRYLHMHDVSLESRAREDDARLVKREKALAAVDFLSVLSPEQRRILAMRGREHWYSTGEAIVRQGEASTELYVVQSGEVVVKRSDTVLARLGPGQFFGEMALMTGEPRNATVNAVQPAALFEIDSEAMRETLEKTPELAEHISRVIAARQTKLETPDAPEAEARDTVERKSSLLLGRIRQFFAL
jgi:CRP-like cAMP-binding protein